MMKKKVWLVLLAMVLVSVLAIFGCGGGGGDDDDDDGEDELVEKVVFDLETDAGIQALTVGAASFAANANPIAPLVRAGGDTNIGVEIVDNVGKKAIKYEVLSGDWGVGIDLRYGPGDGTNGFGFREGDKITVAGKVLTGDANKSLLLNVNVGAAQTALNGTVEYKTGVGDFSFEGVVTADDLKKIKGGGPAGIRLEARAVGFVIQINSINITGMRPTSVKKLDAPVITTSAKGISWTEVEESAGFQLLIGEDGKDFDTVKTLSATTLEYKMTDLADATYKIKLTALGLKDVSKESDPVEVKVKKTTPPGQVTLPATGVYSFATPPATAIANTTGQGTVVAATNGFTFTYSNATEAEVNYGKGYAYFQVDLGAGKTTSKIRKVDFKLVASGDAGYKHIYLLASGAVPTALTTTTDVGIIGDIYAAADNTTVAPFSFEISNIDNTAAGTDVQSPYLAIIFWANSGSGPTSYTISDVVFTLGDPAVFAIVE